MVWRTGFSCFSSRTTVPGKQAGMASETPPSVESDGFSARWTRIIYKLRQPIMNFLHVVTSTSASNPKRTITIVLVLSIGLFVAGLFTNFTLDVGDQLWTPRNSKPVEVSSLRLSDISRFVFKTPNGSWSLARSMLIGLTTILATRKKKGVSICSFMRREEMYWDKIK
jgi:hypothetical protein